MQKGRKWCFDVLKSEIKIVSFYNLSETVMKFWTLPHTLSKGTVPIFHLHAHVYTDTSPTSQNRVFNVYKLFASIVIPVGLEILNKKFCLGIVFYFWIMKERWKAFHWLCLCVFIPRIINSSYKRKHWAWWISMMKRLLAIVCWYVYARIH